MSFKTLLLTGLLSVGLVLVGCSKKEESTSQSKPIQPDEQIDKVDPSADLQAAREAYVDNEKPSKVEGHDFDAHQKTAEQIEREMRKYHIPPKEDEQNDMSSMLNAAAADAQKQADQNK